MRSILEWSQ